MASAAGLLRVPASHASPPAPCVLPGAGGPRRAGVLQPRHLAALGCALERGELMTAAVVPMRAGCESCRIRCKPQGRYAYTRGLPWWTSWDAPCARRRQCALFRIASWCMTKDTLSHCVENRRLLCAPHAAGCFCDNCAAVPVVRFHHVRRSQCCATFACPHVFAAFHDPPVADSTAPATMGKDVTFTSVNFPAMSCVGSAIAISCCIPHADRTSRVLASSNTHTIATGQHPAACATRAFA